MSIKKHRAVLEKQFSNGALSGLNFARGLCAAQDRLVRHLCAKSTLPFSVLAVGGYGRGLLAPHSDIDLVFLVHNTRKTVDPKAVEPVLHPLWDLGFRVSCAVRTPRECHRLARSDLTIRTSLLEARLVWGEGDPFEKMMRTLFARLPVRAFVAARLAARKTAQSRYHVEPDIKDGTGGLRDLDTLGWICKAVAGTSQLKKNPLLSAREQRQFYRFLGFLWTVRCHLHFLAGRGEEILSFALQPELAACFGQPSTPAGVEAVMRRYFVTARGVGGLMQAGLAALEKKNLAPKKRSGRLIPRLWRRRHTRFMLFGGFLNISSPNVFRRPLCLLEFFHAGCVQQLELHPDALRRVRANVWRVSQKVRQNPQACRLFLEILTARQGSEHVLRAMSETGFLERFFPPFKQVIALTQLNRYHHYTVDEHLVRAVGCFNEMERGGGDSFTSVVAAKISDRAVLYLGIFLHDVAKNSPHDHSEAGARIAWRFSRRLGLDVFRAQTVRWLVAHHLLMSHTAQTRDLNDPKTVEDFAATVQDLTRLRLLYLLTEADMRAVGPGTWTAWKARLLRQLFASTAQFLQAPRQAPARQAPARQAPARQAPARHAPSRLVQRYKDFCKAHPTSSPPPLDSWSPSYWLSFDVPTLVRHARTKISVEGFGLQLHPDPLRGASALTLKAYDHPGLFFRLAGACAVLRLNVVEARLFTARDGTVLDVLWVQNEAGLLVETLRFKKIHTVIGQFITGVCARPPNFPAPPGEAPPKILISNTASHTHTVIEVRGTDRRGLLYAIARCFFEAALNVSSAQVATFGDRVVDVFYVQDLLGKKLEPFRQERVCAQLTRALTP